MAAFHVDFDREEDGHWIAEIAERPRVLSYGATKEDAARNAEAIALSANGDSVEQSKRITSEVSS